MQLQRLQLYYDLWSSLICFGPREETARKNRELLQPSTNAQIEPYIKDIWKIVFGSKSIGERALDVKFGEWEKQIGSGLPTPWVLTERAIRSFWRVRPEERDDCVGFCTISKDGGYDEVEV